jgi:hypothetical protein
VCGARGKSSEVSRVSEANEMTMGEGDESIGGDEER